MDNTPKQASGIAVRRTEETQALHAINKPIYR